MFLDEALKATGDFDLRRRLISLICAGWLPHDLISSWASSVLWRESRLRTACPLELVEGSLVGAFVARWLQPPIRLPSIELGGEQIPLLRNGPDKSDELSGDSGDRLLLVLAARE